MNHKRAMTANDARALSEIDIEMVKSRLLLSDALPSYVRLASSGGGDGCGRGSWSMAVNPGAFAAALENGLKELIDTRIHSMGHCQSRHAALPSASPSFSLSFTTLVLQ